MKNLFVKALFLLALLTAHSTLSGQATFMKTIGNGFGYDSGNAVIATSDGNYVVVGMTSNTDSEPTNGYMAKVDGKGEQLWSKTIGGDAEEELLALLELPNSDIIILGYTKSYGAGNEDIFVSRRSKDGVEIWSNTFGGINDERADGIILTTDGNILISGWTKSFGAGQLDVLLLKIHPDGQTIWSKTFGRSGNEWCNFGGLLEDDAGNYVLSGAWTNNFGISGHNGFLFKLDPNGELLSRRIYGGNDNDGMNGYLVEKDGVQHSIGGAWSWNGFNHEIWMSEIGINGALNWSKTFGVENRNIRIGSATTTASGDYLISGHDFSEITKGFGILMKTNTSGDVLWAKSIGGTQVEKIFCSIETEDGILSFGNAKPYANGPSDILMVKTDADGNLRGCSSDLSLNINTVTVEEFGSTSESIGTFPTGNSVIISSNSIDLPEFMTCNSLVAVDYLPHELSLNINVFPNPTDGFFTVKIEKPNMPVTTLQLYNSLGEIIEHQEFSGSTFQKNFDISKRPAGVYFLLIENSNGRLLKKIIHIGSNRV